MIEVRDLIKFYGKRRAVGPLSFTINRGEIVGLLGLNGAGKTTALRILACDLLPSSGTVLVDGIDVVDRPDDVRKLVGYLPDTPPLYGEMTVREYLMFAARLRQVPPDQAMARTNQVLDSTQTRSVADELISSLSHGYRQRVGIAQAIVHHPKFLILDEPIIGLDPVQIVEMRQLLKSLGGDYTIILSSHILPEIRETCDRLLVLREGEIIASATEDELSAGLLKGIRAELIVRGDGEAVTQIVKAVDGVQAVSHTQGQEGLVHLRMEADEDIRERVVRALVHAEVGVLEVKREERELESIFMRLMGTHAGKSAEAKEEG